jgi:glycosyltransferase involved in cell wall biosynthesis
MGGIDVVVPCYQYGRFLTDSVGSILCQSVAGLRVLIIDNGSTDNTREVAQQIADADSRVEVIRYRTNRGQRAGYNLGIEWASSEFFMIFDADDVMAPGCLSRALTLLSTDQSVAFAYGKEIETLRPLSVNSKLDRKSRPHNWCVFRGTDFISRACKAGNNVIGTTTVVRRTSAQKGIGYYPPELEHANDLNMWLRLATLGNVAETTAIQAIRRRHVNQVSAFYREKLTSTFAEILNCFEHFFMNEGVAIEESHVARRTAIRKIASNAFVAGLKRSLRGRPREGGELVEFAFKTWRKFGKPPAFVRVDLPAN